MLACARIGAPHIVVFGGFSADSLAERLRDSRATVLITQDEGWRKGGTVPLKANAEPGRARARRPAGGRLSPYRQPGAVGGARRLVARPLCRRSDTCEPEPMNAEDTLFLLHTSGSTAKPKGALHTTAGYLLHASVTHKWIFDIHEDSTWWCAADVGWITGHSYIVYGPLNNGTTSVLYEGDPVLPRLGPPLADRRALRRHLLLHGADAHPLVRQDGRGVSRPARPLLAAAARDSRRTDQPRGMGLVLAGDRRRTLSDRRYLVADGERGHPDHALAGCRDDEARVGDDSLPRDPARRSSTSTASREAGRRRLPGDQPAVAGHVPHPVRRRRALRETYFSKYGPDVYVTGDGAKQDEDGYFWLMGRIDDVINVAGHRLSTTEIESTLVEHPAVAEAAATGAHDPNEASGSSASSC